MKTQEITVYEDITNDGIHYTIYRNNRYLGEYLPDSETLNNYLKAGVKVITCDWRKTRS